MFMSSLKNVFRTLKITFGPVEVSININASAASKRGSC